MLYKLEYLCAVASIALLGADRIDLFAGNAPFRLSSFLFFGSSLVLLEFLSMSQRRGFQVKISPPVRRQIPFLVVLGLFLLLAFNSTIVGEDPQRGLVSLCGLLALAVLGYFLSVRIISETSP